MYPLNNGRMGVEENHSIFFGIVPDHPFLWIFRIFHVAIRHMGSQSFATLALCFLYRTNLSACILCEKFVEPVFNTGNVTVGTFGGDAVKVVVDSDVADIALRESKDGCVQYGEERNGRPGTGSPITLRHRRGFFPGISAILPSKRVIAISAFYDKIKVIIARFAPGQNSEI